MKGRYGKGFANFFKNWKSFNPNVHSKPYSYWDEVNKKETERDKNREIHRILSHKLSLLKSFQTQSNLNEFDLLNKFKFDSASREAIFMSGLFLSGYSLGFLLGKEGPANGVETKDPSASSLKTDENSNVNTQSELKPPQDPTMKEAEEPSVKQNDQVIEESAAKQITAGPQYSLRMCLAHFTLHHTVQTVNRLHADNCSPTPNVYNSPEDAVNAFKDSLSSR